MGTGPLKLSARLTDPPTDHGGYWIVIGNFAYLFLWEMRMHGASTSPREIEIFLSLFYHYFDAPVGY